MESEEPVRHLNTFYTSVIFEDFFKPSQFENSSSSTSLLVKDKESKAFYQLAIEQLMPYSHAMWTKVLRD